MALRAGQERSRRDPVVRDKRGVRVPPTIAGHEAKLNHITCPQMYTLNSDAIHQRAIGAVLISQIKTVSFGVHQRVFT